MAKKKSANQKEKDLLVQLRKRFDIMYEADEENLYDGMEDMKFVNVPGYQWEEHQKKNRGKRPCYEFNKVRINAKRVINEIRANRPQGKIRGVEGTDKQQADYREGLIRNIWSTSDGDTVVDYAAEYQVSAGMGAWRITTDYADDHVFDQDIKIEIIQNPFCLLNDPAARDMLKRDADDWILSERISKKEFKEKWPNAEPVNWDGHEFDSDEEWESEDQVRIAEYWYKEPIQKELWQLDDGLVIDSESDEAAAMPAERIKKKRVIDTHKIMMFIASGNAILEGPTEWAGTMHPFIKVFGEYMVVDGRIYWYGLGRWAKDAQRSYNVSRTAITETIASAPLATTWVTPAQAEGHVDKWAEAHTKNFFFKMYNPDPKAPGPPQRTGGADVPIALIQESQIASQEIDDVTGIHADDRGQQSASQSGRAIYARQEQGQVVTFNYPDNMSKGIQRTWELLIDLIPHVYDTEREMRILGNDGKEDYLTINKFVQGPDGEQIKINDMSVGRYDVTITTGPSFSTKRQEAAETYQALTQGNPALFPVIGDLIFKSMDLPFSEDIAERLQAMLPPEIQNLKNKEQDVPPEVQIMIQQAEQAMTMVEQQSQQVQQAAGEAQVDKAEVERLTADLETKTAQFEAKVAKEVARITQMEAKLTIHNVESERDGVMEQGREVLEGERQQFNAELAGEMAQSVQTIQEMAAQFNEYAVQMMAQIRQEADNKPKIVEVKAVRKDGQLSAVPVYDNEGNG